MPVTSISMNLDDDLYQRLEKVALDMKRKKEWLVNEAVKQFVESVEQEFRRHEETLEALDSVERGEYHDGQEVLDWMDRWFSANELPVPKLHK